MRAVRRCLSGLRGRSGRSRRGRRRRRGWTGRGGGHSGLDDRDLDAERCDLGDQCVRQSLDRVLGRGQQSHTGVGGLPVDRGALEDVSGSLGAEYRQCRAEHVEHSEDVGVEHGAGLRVGGFLDGSEESVAGVVGDHVDAAEPRERALHRFPDGLLVTHVCPDEEQAVAVRFGQFVQGSGVAGDRRDGIAALQYLEGQFAADAGRRAGDEPCAGGGLLV